MSEEPTAGGVATAISEVPVPVVPTTENVLDQANAVVASTGGIPNPLAGGPETTSQAQAIVDAKAAEVAGTTAKKGGFFSFLKRANPIKAETVNIGGTSSLIPEPAAAAAAVNQLPEGANPNLSMTGESASTPQMPLVTQDAHEAAQGEDAPKFATATPAPEATNALDASAAVAEADSIVKNAEGVNTAMNEIDATANEAFAKPAEAESSVMDEQHVADAVAEATTTTPVYQPTADLASAEPEKAATSADWSAPSSTETPTVSPNTSSEEIANQETSLNPTESNAPAELNPTAPASPLAVDTQPTPPVADPTTEVPAAASGEASSAPSANEAVVASSPSTTAEVPAFTTDALSSPTPDEAVPSAPAEPFAPLAIETGSEPVASAQTDTPKVLTSSEMDEAIRTSNNVIVEPAPGPAKEFEGTSAQPPTNEQPAAFTDPLAVHTEPTSLVVEPTTPTTPAESLPIDPLAVNEPSTSPEVTTPTNPWDQPPVTAAIPPTPIQPDAIQEPSDQISTATGAPTAMDGSNSLAVEQPTFSAPLADAPEQTDTVVPTVPGTPAEQPTLGGPILSNESTGVVDSAPITAAAATQPLGTEEPVAA